MEMKFEIGDVVTLNSGGAKMTIEAVGPDMVRCVLATPNGLERLAAHPVMLRRVESVHVAVGSGN